MVWGMSLDLTFLAAAARATRPEYSGWSFSRSMALAVISSTSVTSKNWCSFTRLEMMRPDRFSAADFDSNSQAASGRRRFLTQPGLNHNRLNFCRCLVQMLKCFDKLTGLLALLWCEGFPSFSGQQHFQQSRQMKLELFILGMRGHERAYDCHDACLCGNQGVQLVLQLVIFQRDFSLGFAVEEPSDSANKMLCAVLHSACIGSKPLHIGQGDPARRHVVNHFRREF